VADLPLDPTEILRAIDRLRAAILPGVGDAMPQAVESAAEITAALHRLTDEVARLNANIEAAKPLIESIERQVSRSMPVFDSVQGIQQAIRRTMGGRSSGEAPSEGPPAGPSEGPAAGPSEPPPQPGSDEPLR
jgi:hypothetical protein